MALIRWTRFSADAFGQQHGAGVAGDPGQGGSGGEGRTVVDQQFDDGARVGQLHRRGEDLPAAEHAGNAGVEHRRRARLGGDERLRGDVAVRGVLLQRRAEHGQDGGLGQAPGERGGAGGHGFAGQRLRHGRSLWCTERGRVPAECGGRAGGRACRVCPVVGADGLRALQGSRHQQGPRGAGSGPRAPPGRHAPGTLSGRTTAAQAASMASASRSCSPLRNTPASAVINRRRASPRERPGRGCRLHNSFGHAAEVLPWREVVRQRCGSGGRQRPRSPPAELRRRERGVRATGRQPGSPRPRGGRTPVPPAASCSPAGWRPGRRCRRPRRRRTGPGTEVRPHRSVHTPPIQ